MALHLRAPEPATPCPMPGPRNAVTFYGVNFEFFDANDLAEKPVQAHFGQRDIMEGFSDPQTGQKLLNELRGADNEESHAFIYKDCGHSFMNWDPVRPPARLAERKRQSSVGQVCSFDLD